jgi:hypothetical protein
LRTGVVIGFSSLVKQASTEETVWPLQLTSVFGDDNNDADDISQNLADKLFQRILNIWLAFFIPTL